MKNRRRLWRLLRLHRNYPNLIPIFDAEHPRSVHGRDIQAALGVTTRKWWDMQPHIKRSGWYRPTALWSDYWRSTFRHGRVEDRINRLIERTGFHLNDLIFHYGRTTTPQRDAVLTFFRHNPGASRADCLAYPPHVRIYGPSRLLATYTSLHHEGYLQSERAEEGDRRSNKVYITALYRLLHRQSVLFFRVKYLEI